MGLLDWFQSPPRDTTDSYGRAIEGEGSQLQDDVWGSVKSAWDRIRPVRDVAFAPFAIGDMLMGQYTAWAGGDAGRQAYRTAWDRKRSEIEQAEGAEHFAGPLGALREIEAAPGLGDVLAEVAVPGDDPSYTEVQRFVKRSTAMVGNMFTNPVNLVGGGVAKGAQAWDRAMRAPSIGSRAAAMAESVANMYGSAIPVAAYAPEIAGQVVGGAQTGYQGLQEGDTDKAVAGFGEAVLGATLAGLGVKGALHEAKAVREYRGLRRMSDIEVAIRQEALAERFMDGDHTVAPELDIANSELKSRAGDRQMDEDLGLAIAARDEQLAAGEQASAETLALARQVTRETRPEPTTGDLVDRRLAALRRRATEAPRVEEPRAAYETVVDREAGEAATAPGKPQPTAAALEAGRYEKGKTEVSGLPIAIENPVGSVRRGRDETGREWATRLKAHYGYIEGVKGKDKDQLDVFVRPGLEPEHEGPVYVVNQRKADGSFDEHKVMLGWGSKDEVRDAYLANYDERGPQLIQSIAEFGSPEAFKAWMKTEGALKKPAPTAARASVEEPIVLPEGFKPTEHPAPEMGRLPLDTVPERQRTAARKAAQAVSREIQKGRGGPEETARAMAKLPEGLRPYADQIRSHAVQDASGRIQGAELLETLRSNYGDRGADGVAVARSPSHPESYDVINRQDGKIVAGAQVTGGRVTMLSGSRETIDAVDNALDSLGAKRDTNLTVLGAERRRQRLAKIREAESAKELGRPGERLGGPAVGAAAEPEPGPGVPRGAPGRGRPAELVPEPAEAAGAPAEPAVAAEPAAAEPSAERPVAPIRAAQRVAEPTTEYGAGRPEPPPADPFYSQLKRTAEKIPQAMSGNDMLRYLSDPKRGIKVDELKWTGLDDFLRGRPRATREEVQQFLAENEVRIGEKVLGGQGLEPGWEIVENEVGKFNLRRPDGGLELDNQGQPAVWSQYPGAQNALESRARKADPKFSAYRALPGGENYREVVVSLPGVARKPAPRDVTPDAQAQREYRDRLDRLIAEREKADRDIAEARAMPKQKPEGWTITQGDFGFWVLKDERGETVATSPHEANLLDMAAQRVPGGPARVRALHEAITMRANAVSRIDGVHQQMVQDTISRMPEPKRAKWQVETPPKGHYLEPGVVFHTRLDDRWVPDANGLTVKKADGTFTRDLSQPGERGHRALLVQELQSDWAQKGRDEEFAKEPTEAERLLADRGRDIRRQLDAARDKWRRAADAVPTRPVRDSILDWWWDLYGTLRQKRGGGTRENIMKDVEIGLDLESITRLGAVWKIPEGLKKGLYDERSPEYTAMLRAEEQVRRLSREQTDNDRQLNVHKAGRVAPGPFVTETGEWTELALKRVIKMAADEGYDRVAWTTGEQQVELYSEALRSQVDEIRWQKTKGGVHLLGSKARSTVVDTTERETALSAAIGKTMADQILGSPEQSGVISGRDIKISDTGMAGFYDQIVPQVAAKIGKKWGAKVGETKLPRDIESLPGMDMEEGLSLLTPDDLRRVAASVGPDELRARVLMTADVLGSDGPKAAARTVTSGTQKDAVWSAVLEKRKGELSVGVHSIDISPEMRRSVRAEGFSLFETRTEYETAVNAVPEDAAKRNLAYETASMSGVSKRHAGPAAPRNRPVASADGRQRAGPITFDQWLGRATRELGGVGSDDWRTARRWYGDLRGKFVEVYGERDADRMLTLWALSQQQTSPSGGLGFVYRAIEKAAGVEGLPKAGLSEPRLLGYLKGQFKKLGQKLTDFLDATHGRQRRSWTGGEGQFQPAPFDIWAMRDLGYVDPAFRDMLPPEMARGVTLDNPKGVPGSRQYLHGLQQYNEFARLLNERNVDGGGWLAAEAQALGWSATQRAMGRRPEDIRDIFSRNTRGVFFEVTGFPEGSELGSRYGPLTIDQQRSVSKAVGPKLFQRAADAVGATVVGVESSYGGWQGGVNSNVVGRLVGTREQVEDAARIIGLSAQQGEVLFNRPMVKGRPGAEIRIDSELASSPEFALAVWQRAVDLEPQMAGAGFTLSTDSQGRPAMLVLDPRPKRIAQAIAKAVDALDTNATVDVTYGKYDTGSVSNDWRAQPNGEAYRADVERRRATLVGRPLDDLVSAFRTDLDAAVRDAGGVVREPERAPAAPSAEPAVEAPGATRVPPEAPRAVPEEGAPEPRPLPAAQEAAGAPPEAVPTPEVKAGPEPALRAGERTRPETRQQAQQQALESLDRAAQPMPEVQTVSGRLGPEERGGVSTLGVAISTEGRRTGWIDLRGKRVRGPRDVAVAAQVFRNPSYESFYVIGTKGNRIVAHRAWTSRVPNQALVVKQPGRDFSAIARWLERSGADSYYLVHNHPGGFPEPSVNDARLTDSFASKVSELSGGRIRLKSHVVIDSGKYGVIKEGAWGRRKGRKERWGSTELGRGKIQLFDLPGWNPENEKFLVARLPHPELGRHAASEKLIASLGQRLQTDPSKVTLVYLTSRGNVQAIQEVPLGLFLKPSRLAEWVRGRSREFGASMVAAYHEPSAEMPAKAFYDAATRLVQGNILADVVSVAFGKPSGVRGAGVEPLPITREQFMGRDVGRHAVAETGAGYKPEVKEYEPSGVPKAPGEEPRVEQRVSHIEAMARSLGVEAPTLKRETVEHWSALDEPIREIVRTRTVEQLAATAEKRILTNVEVQALDAMNRGVQDQTYEYLSEIARAERRGDKAGMAAAEQRYMGETMRAIAIERALVNDGSNAARALQARARIMAAAPEGPGKMMQKIIRELPGLSVKQQAELLAAAQRDPLRAKDMLRAAFSPGWKNKILEWWKAGLLSAPKTDMAMLMGNSAEFFSRLGETAMGGLTERALAAVGAIPKGKTRYAREEVGQEISGAMDAFFPALKEWWENVRNFTGPEKPLTTAAKLEHQVGAIGGTLGKIVRWPFRRAEAHDVLFRRIGGRGDLKKFSWRKAREELGAGAPVSQVERRATEIMEQAEAGTAHGELIEEVAQINEQRTFQQSNPFAVPILKFKQQFPLAGNLLAPFVLTPTNIAASVVKRSPLGFLTHGVSTLRRFRSGLATRAEVIDAFAAPLFGSTLLGAMVVLAKSGMLTGGGPPDQREKGLLKETGWQPYSFVLIDPKNGRRVYVPFNRFEPISSTLGIAADLAEMEDPKRRGDLMKKGVESIAQNFTNKSYMQSVVDGLNFVTDPSKFGRQWISSTVTSLIPNVFAATAQAIDPVVRDLTPSEAGIFGTPEKIMRQGASRLPFVSRLLAPKPSPSGEIIERPGWGPTRILFPVQITEEREGRQLEKMLVRIGYVPGTPRRTLTHRGQEIPLGDADYRLLLEADRAAATRVRALMSTAGFGALPDTEEEAAEPGESKEGKVRSIYTKARQEARKLVFARPEIRSKMFDIRRGRRLASIQARAE